MAYISVPNNETFSLEDVYNSVDSHANPSGNLSSCFSNAVESYFDPDYNNNEYAPVNSMLRFRNYTPRKIYLITFHRICDADNQYANTVSWQNINCDTDYFIEGELTNPDEYADGNITFNFVIEEAWSALIEVTWVKFQKYVPTSYVNQYIVCDHDYGTMLKDHITDLPVSYGNSGDTWTYAIANNLSIYFYFKIRIKPYANQSFRKQFSVLFTQDLNYLITFTNPSWDFLCAYYNNSAFQHYWPNPVATNGIFHAYGYAGCTEVKLYTQGGNYIHSWYIAQYNDIDCPMSDHTVTAGSYYFMFCDSNGNEIGRTGTIIVVDP